MVTEKIKNKQNLHSDTKVQSSSFLLKFVLKVQIQSTNYRKQIQFIIPLILQSKTQMSP